MPHMSADAFTLILFSALMHALWNLMVKRSRDKTVFIWWMFVVSGSLLNIVVWTRPEPWPVPTPTVLLLVLGGAICFVLYHLFNGRAYQTGDLSLAYPLSQTSMLYVPIWGMLLFGERLSLLGIAGILLVLFGTYSIQMQRLSLNELTRPLRSLGNPSVRAALMAGFIYSIGSVLDKQGVMLYPPLYFTHLLVIAMFVIMTLNLMRPSCRGRIMAEWRQSRRLILLVGPVMLGSFVAFRYGLQMAPVSYAVPVRQASLLIAVALGVLFLGEACGRIRFMASSLILVGVFMVRFG
jgi:drug/metabolite transporter (DMT)-like permease